MRWQMMPWQQARLEDLRKQQVPEERPSDEVGIPLYAELELPLVPEDEPEDDSEEARGYEVL